MMSDARSDSVPHDRPTIRVDRDARRLLLGMLAAPLAWLLHLSISFALVRVSCAWGIGWVHHVTAAAALLVAFPGGWAAWKEWRETPRDDEPASNPQHRLHFLSIAGMANTAFFSLIIVLSWVAALVVSECALAG